MGFHRLAVFASGGGSNFQALLEDWRRGGHPLEPVALLSDRGGAPALDKARAAGLDTAVFGRGCWGPEAERAGEVLDWLRDRRVDVVALAGFLRRVPPALVAAFRGRMVNIHPALLPSFGGPGMYGHFVHEAVWRAGCRVSGATVHLVDEAYDRGPILLQKAVELDPDDGPAEIAARVLAVEHEIYPRALALLADPGITLQDGRAVPCRAHP
jgi:phosphoribosylglycinamide formyltransferase-1